MMQHGKVKWDLCPIELTDRLYRVAEKERNTYDQ